MLKNYFREQVKRAHTPERPHVIQQTPWSRMGFYAKCGLFLALRPWRVLNFSVFVSLAYMTKFHKQWLTTRNVLSHHLEARRLRLGCQWGQALVKAPSLACRQPPSYHELTWPFPGACAQRELKLSGVSSYRDTNTIRPGPCPHDQVTPKGPISKDQHIEFGGWRRGIIQPVTTS